ncbi:uncharacterized protein TNCV_4058091 [Trichonephila clavipes]|nr:uncharacterized protein TNCV_4058091 [Trichonephila clavipes]
MACLISTSHHMKIPKIGSVREQHQKMKRSFDAVSEISENEFIRIHKEALVEKQFDFRYQMGHSNNIVTGCIFKGTPHLRGNECLQRFSLSFDPDFGNCFSFSTRGRKNRRPLSAREADFWQDENDLTLLLDAQNEEFTEMKREPGLILTVHSDATVPDIHTDGIKVETGVNYNFAVQEPTPVQSNFSLQHQIPHISFITRYRQKYYSLRLNGLTEASSEDESMDVVDDTAATPDPEVHSALIRAHKKEIACKEAGLSYLNNILNIERKDARDTNTPTVQSLEKDVISPPLGRKSLGVSA